MGYIPWGHKESDMTEQLSTHSRTSQEASPRFFFFFSWLHHVVYGILVP